MQDKHLDVLEQEEPVSDFTLEDFEDTFTNTVKTEITIRGKKRNIEVVLADRVFSRSLEVPRDDRPPIVRDYQDKLNDAALEGTEKLKQVQKEIQKDFSQEELDIISKFNRERNERILIKGFVNPNIVADDSSEDGIPISKVPLYVQDALLDAYNDINEAVVEGDFESTFQTNGKP